jgi:peptidoglycan/LPS O-acetylase OafA/YrhL
MGLSSYFAWKPLRYIGTISYSLYIWHFLFIVLFAAYVPTHLHGLHPTAKYALYWAWVGLAVIPFSLLFFVVVERPWMLVSARLGRTKKPVSS